MFKYYWNRFHGIQEWRLYDPDGEDYQLPKLYDNDKGSYIKFSYSNVEDMFQRPISSEPNSYIDVVVRSFDQTAKGFNKPFLFTKRSKRCLNLASYNYLGFGGVNDYTTPAVRKSLKSHPITVASPAAEFGNTQVHRRCEKMIAKFLGKEDALLLGMGFASNSTVLPALVGKGDLIISDELNHSSIVQGCRESGAKIKAFKHNCAVDLELILAKATLLEKKYNKILIIVEGIYSMEGDFCNLKDIVRVAKKYKAYVYLDEAHSIGATGATGRGATEELGVDRKDVDIMMGTLTKSFGSTGGYIAGERRVINRIRRFSAGCTDSVTIPPACAVQIIESLRVIAGEDGTDIGKTKLRAIRENSTFFRQGLIERGFEVLGSDGSPVVPMMLYDPGRFADFSRLCFANGIATVCIGPPAVPQYYMRARFCISAAHTRDDLKKALDVVDRIGTRLGVKFKSTDRPNRLFPGTLDCEEARLEAQRKKSLAKLDAMRERVGAALRGIKYAPLAPPESKKDGPLLPRLSGWVGGDSIPAEAKLKANLSMLDVLGFAERKEVKAACIETLNNKGCGSCGPRGFYGTLTEHVEAENAIAEFLGTAQCMIYSYGACTTSSVIPSMAGRGDVLLVDEGISRNVLSGITLSRAKVVYYRHCDIQDCERKLQALEREEIDNFRMGKRMKIIISEAIFQSTGKLAPVDKLCALRIKYRCRFILDESLSFGVLGETGRGATEHFGVPVTAVDVICGSLESSCATCCGFAAGATGVLACQRLLGAGYIFSASCPPYLATSITASLRELEKNPSLLSRLQFTVGLIREELKKIPGLTTVASEVSPMVPLRLSNPTGDEAKDARALDEIARICQARGVAICRMAQNPLARKSKFAMPALRLCASLTQSPQAVQDAIAVLKEATATVVGRLASAAASIKPSDSKSSRTPGFQERRVPGIEPKKSAARSMEPDTEFYTMTIPIIMVFSYLVNLYRKFLNSQTRITNRFTAGYLRYLSLDPNSNSTLVRAFYMIATILGSHTFFHVVCTSLVFACDSPGSSMVFVTYCTVSGLGWMIKSLMTTDPTENVARCRTWPSVSCMNAVVLPFFLMRWGFGEWWLYNEFGIMSILIVIASVVWLLVVIVGRLHGGDSPSNIQGGLVLGAIWVQVWTRVAHKTIRWFQGDFRFSCPPLLASVIVLTLTPMPLSKGKFVKLSKIYYERAATILVHNIFFMLGSMAVPPIDGTLATAPQMLYRAAIGFFIYAFFMFAASKLSEAISIAVLTSVGAILQLAERRTTYVVLSKLLSSAACGFFVGSGIPIILRKLDPLEASS